MVFDGWMLPASLIHHLRLNSRLMPSCKRWHTKKATESRQSRSVTCCYHHWIHGTFVERLNVSLLGWEFSLSFPWLLPVAASNSPGPLKERLRVLHSELHERIQREETSRVGILADLRTQETIGKTIGK